MGDPCSPKAFAWEGLNCTYPPAGLSRITALNLSSNGLVGSIATYFGDMKALQYLLGNNANLCGNGTTTTCGSGRRKMEGALLTALVIPIVAVIALFVLLIFLLCRIRKEKAKRRANRPKDETALLENREFSYRELKHITNNFSQEIGKGGFGAAFLGYLENGNPVAVKVRSESSSQGGKEFLAEAQHLTRIHHKNLVSLIGYCKDKNHLALVYEYMPEGNLQDHLRDTSTSKSLTWEQRLQIALGAAQGLEYLHVGCKPALIHRDVKSRNILLTADLGAKIADFGLTKVFSDSKTHITTEPAGTMGYLDPEYVLYSVYDVNSLWKAANLALHCKQEISRERPTMTDVVAQIKESMELEARRDGKRNSAMASDDLSYAGNGSAFEVEGSAGKMSQASPGPAMR
ncbi:hypothetical protein C2845_PM11G14540 [Panicum miliaceum]|uniref:non-specific serine/threonine protein kinase n=1 Tax=Panicum miliaceum TaxID=4540 RepID=A0A3L6RPP6_PANMI|nr:hypothetical protein C2845_PM11G14540 [Panicum miliaceum]